MMRILIPALALALAACVGALPATATLAPPAAVADRTVLDEKAGIIAETAYTGASHTGVIAVRRGLVPAERFRAADQRAYDGLRAIRAAYDAGNATNYALALASVYAAIADLTSMTKGR